MNCIVIPLMHIGSLFIHKIANTYRHVVLISLNIMIKMSKMKIELSQIYNELQVTKMLTKKDKQSNFTVELK